METSLNRERYGFFLYPVIKQSLELLTLCQL